MTTMTMPTIVERAAPPAHTRDVSQLRPFLLALALLVVSASAFVLISGPMH